MQYILFLAIEQMSLLRRHVTEGVEGIIFGSLMRIIVNIEEDCIGLIEFARETEGKDAEETSG
jgi:hypothetical protein